MLWSKVSALTVEARAGLALRMLAQEEFVEITPELLYTSVVVDEADEVGVDELVEEVALLVCAVDVLELLELLVGVCADNVSVAACTKELRSPVAL
jgi:hypothetical protein